MGYYTTFEIEVTPGSLRDRVLKTIEEVSSYSTDNGRHNASTARRGYVVGKRTLFDHEIGK